MFQQPPPNDPARYNSPVPQGEYLQYGGQAIIEGVMMRSPRHVAVAVLAPDGEIILQCEPIEKTWIGRQKWLHKPFLRGSWALLDAMTLGIRAMRFASKILLDPKYEQHAKKEAPGSDGAGSTNGESKTPVSESHEVAKSRERIQGAVIGITIVVSLVFAFFLFNYVPNLLATLLKGRGIDQPVHINMVTEGFKILMTFGYILLIAQLPDIKRVFQFHGAEHKAINALEAEQEMTPENCRLQTRLHPRCGTSFIVIVLMVQVLVFTFLPKPEIDGSRFLTSIARVLVEIPFLPVIAGISYEIIRFAGKMRNSALVMGLLRPGLWTQLITTKEPDETQIRVALASLKAVVDAEKAGQTETVTTVVPVGAEVAVAG